MPNIILVIENSSCSSIFTSIYIYFHLFSSMFIYFHYCHPPMFKHLQLGEAFKWHCDARPWPRWPAAATERPLAGEKQVLADFLGW